ncbi:MAG TPA: tetratricopeptide repeat protein [Candidatus Brocadiia bacterium]|nr:tetratricopeptide repeat protein [Candidatus Brocadiia bacterium]
MMKNAKYFVMTILVVSVVFGSNVPAQVETQGESTKPQQGYAKSFPGKPCGFYSSIADVFIRHKEPGEAERWVRMGLESSSDPQNRDKLLLSLAEAIEKQGKIEETIEILKKLCDSPDARLQEMACQQLASVYLRAKRYDDAEPLLQLDIEKATTSLEKDRRRNSLFNTYIMHNRIPQAIKTYEDRLSKNKDDMEAIHMLADLYMRKEESSKAVPLLERLTASSPDDSHLKSNLAQAYVSSGRIEPAIRIYEELLRANPGQKEHWVWRMSVAYQQMGMREEASECGRRLLREAGEDINMIIGGGKILSDCRKPLDAAQAYMKAADMTDDKEGGKGRLLLIAAKQYVEGRQFDKAEKLARELIESGHEIDVNAAKRLLADILEAQGRTEELDKLK